MNQTKDYMIKIEVIKVIKIVLIKNYEIRVDKTILVHRATFLMKELNAMKVTLKA